MLNCNRPKTISREGWKKCRRLTPDSRRKGWEESSKTDRGKSKLSIMSWTHNSRKYGRWWAKDSQLKNSSCSLNCRPSMYKLKIWSKSSTSTMTSWGICQFSQISRSGSIKGNWGGKMGSLINLTIRLRIWREIGQMRANKKELFRSYTEIWITLMKRGRKTGRLTIS